MNYVSKMVLNTYQLASKLAKCLRGGEIILLNGDLGAGKTTFVKGVAKALKIKEVVTSPTFTLLKTYQAEKFMLVHIDAYRLNEESFEEMSDYMSAENVLFIEWSSCLTNQEFFKECLEINIKYVDKNTREFTFKAIGTRYEKMLKELM